MRAGTVALCRLFLIDRKINDCLYDERHCRAEACLRRRRRRKCWNPYGFQTARACPRPTIRQFVTPINNHLYADSDVLLRSRQPGRHERTGAAHCCNSEHKFFSFSIAIRCQIRYNSTDNRVSVCVGVCRRIQIWRKRGAAERNGSFCGFFCTIGPYALAGFR